jgi:hypothetical protein
MLPPTFFWHRFQACFPCIFVDAADRRSMCTFANPGKVSYCMATSKGMHVPVEQLQINQLMRCELTNWCAD